VDLCQAFLCRAVISGLASINRLLEVKKRCLRIKALPANNSLGRSGSFISNLTFLSMRPGFAFVAFGTAVAAASALKRLRKGPFERASNGKASKFAPGMVADKIMTTA
jgi:hypothetical protein